MDVKYENLLFAMKKVFEYSYMTFMHRSSLGSARKRALTCTNVAKNYKAFLRHRPSLI